jgi:hypothetical protein
MSQNAADLELNHSDELFSYLSDKAQTQINLVSVFIWQRLASALINIPAVVFVKCNTQTLDQQWSMFPT